MAELLMAKLALSAATFAIDKPYDYLVPPGLAERIRPGMRVLAPFGRGNRTCDGVVLALETCTQRPQGVKSILTLLDDAPVLSPQFCKLAVWMARRYFCTVYQAIKAMLPAGLWFSVQDLCKLTADRETAYAAAGRSDSAQRIVTLLLAQKNGMSISELRLAFGEKDPMPALKKLIQADVAAIEPNAQRNVGDKTEQTAVLALPPEDALAQAALRRKTAPLQYSVVELLCAVGQAGMKELCYLTGASPTTVRALAKRGVLKLERREILRTPVLESVPPAGELILSPSQEAAFRELDALAQSENPGCALLYGVTGSGKTQVYVRLIQETLRRGRTALVLAPEIALTPQLLRIFASYFGEKVALLHSSLPAGERYDEWKRIKSGKAKVVVGTRSAVFAPLDDLGLVVLDEEQEASYKSENVPRYHAREVAQYLAAGKGALVLLGSATPSVESMYYAQTGRYRLVTLEGRYNRQALPQVIISDMKRQLRQGSDSDIGEELSAELTENLQRGEQSILLLNRRGARRMAVCESCGEAPTCPRCSVRLTYHSANRRLMCHYCGHSQPLPDACPQCGGRLTFVGTGTQRLQAALEALFPGREILRMDADSVSPSNSHQAILDRFAKKGAPILLGTQMVAKGLDFENVTLVGVVDADSGLYLGDFRANERTFSLITQVVGRAGRGEKKGRAVIQTYTPDNDVIVFAAAQDYDSFYAQELELRRARGMPPFRELFVITASGLQEEAVLRACQRMRQSLERAMAKPPYSACGGKLLGPAPAAVAKVNNRFRYQLTLSCEKGGGMRALIGHFLRQGQLDKENRGVSLFGDHNPMD